MAHHQVSYTIKEIQSNFYVEGIQTFTTTFLCSFSISLTIILNINLSITTFLKYTFITLGSKNK